MLFAVLPLLARADAWQGLYPLDWPTLRAVEERIEKNGGEAAASPEDLWQRALLSRTRSDRLTAERAAAAAQRLEEAGDTMGAARFHILEAWARLGFDRSTAVRQLDDIARSHTLPHDSFEKGILSLAFAERHLWTDNHRTSQYALQHADDIFAKSGDEDWRAIVRTRSLLARKKFFRFSELHVAAAGRTAEAEGLSLAQALYWKGEALLGMGRPAEALSAANATFDLLGGHERTALTVAALSLRARAHLANGSPHQAKAHTQEAIRTARSQDRLDLIADLKSELALAHFQMGNKETADQTVRQAVDSLATYGADRRRALPHIQLAEMALRKNDLIRAKIHFQRARLYALLSQRDWRIRIYHGLYEAAVREGDASEALRHFTRASELRQQFNDVLWEERLHAAAAELEELSRNKEEAVLARTESLRAESRRQEARIRNLLFLGMVLALLLLLLLWHRYTAQREQNRVLLLAAQKARQAELRETEANRAKTEFLANITHEFRTPLNGIIGMASLLQETSLDADQQECIRIVHDCGNNLLQIIGDILDLARLEAGQFVFDAQVFDLPACLRTIEEKSARIVAQRGLAWTAEIPPDLPRYVFGEEARIRQIIENLIENAIKFTPEGSIRLIARAHIPQAKDHDAVAHLEFAIEDTGIGISRQLQGEIFRAFRQADLSNTRNCGGAGLGLTMAHRLSQLMGGGICCESEEGKGSRFVAAIRLPVRTQAPPLKPDYTLPPVSPERLGNPESISLRDPERTIRVLLFRVGRNLRASLGGTLERMGLAFEASNEAGHLREAFRSRTTEIIFLRLTEDDWQNTIEWIQELLEEENVPNGPTPYIVGLDATGIPNVVKAAYAAGFDEVVPTRGSASRLPTVLLKTGLFNSGIS